MFYFTICLKRTDIYSFKMLGSVCRAARDMMGWFGQFPGEQKFCAVAVSNCIDWMRIVISYSIYFVTPQPEDLPLVGL